MGSCTQTAGNFADASTYESYPVRNSEHGRFLLMSAAECDLLKWLILESKL